MSRKPSMADAAAELAANGFAVFRLKPKGKKPFATGWQKEATTNRKQARQLFEATPRANIGIATGNPSGIIVLDVDVKNDAPGFASLRKLKGEIRKLTDTVRVRTPSGGLHLYYVYDADDVRNSASKIGKGLDIRGTGGYVVAPGSTVDGKQYEWMPGSKADGTYRRLPAALKRLLTTDSQTDGERSDDSVQIIPKGKRNDELLRIAGSLRRTRGSTPEAILAALRIHNEQRCKPPLPDKELRHIVKSAMKYKDKDLADALPACIRDLKPMSLDWIDEEPSGLDWLVHALIAKEEIGAVAGKGGSLKSSVILRLAIGMVLGRTTLDLRIDHPRKVLYCMLERHERSFRRRVHKAINQLLDELKLEDEDLEAARKLLTTNWFPKPMAGEHLGLIVKEGQQWTMNLPVIDELIGIIKRKGIDLIVIDTISRLHGGSGIDDALAATMVKALERVCSATDAGILFLAHVGKNGTGDQYAIFGSSVWGDNTSNLIFMKTRDPKELAGAEVRLRGKVITLSATDVVTCMEQVRTSDYAPHPKRYYRGIREGDRAGQIDAIDVFFKGGGLDAAVTAVREFCDEHGAITQRQFHTHKLAGPSIGRPGQVDAFDELVNTGQLRLHGDSTYKRYLPADTEPVEKSAQRSGKRKTKHRNSSGKK